MLPHLHGEPFRSRIAFLLVALDVVNVDVFIVVVRRSGSLVESARASGAQELLAVGWEQLGFLGHAKGQLDVPDIVFLRSLCRLGRCYIDPFLSPLAYR